ncbi:hypothetical protein WJX84_007024 [Apatococcus fuscideae]|uniref:Rab-GAP TBC domain-containing protein n=1 Tax=Apatococcus fuscideae TaxID=2026836 RepID=A0AAW1TCG1_9CHLO
MPASSENDAQPSDRAATSASSSAEPQLDAYGFRLPSENLDQAGREASDKEQEEMTEKWSKYAKQRSLPSAAKLKRYCRRGIPPSIRPWAWPEISGANQRKHEHQAGYYALMVRQGEAGSECAHQIDLDLPRTFPLNAWVAGSAGQTALRRVLLAFSMHKPTVGYCQSMNYIAAMLLLVLNKCEEDAFWVLVALIDDGILYRDMYANNLLGTHVEMRSLEELLGMKLPRLRQHLVKLQCDITIIATDWFLCLFATVLPSESAMRVWDALLHEGPKVLYRMALALLKMQEEVLLQQDNPGFVLHKLKRAAHATHDRAALMKVAFEGVGSMPMARIEGFREQKQEVVQVELRRRETRQQLQKAISDNDTSDHDVLSSRGISAFADKIKLTYTSRRRDISSIRRGSPSSSH